MPTLENDFLRFTIASTGEITSLKNKRVGVEYIAVPRGFWRLILQQGLKDEISVYPTGQEVSVTLSDQRLTVDYCRLRLGGRTFRISLHFEFTLVKDEIIATASVMNDDDLKVIEVVFPLIDGIRTLGGSAADDALIWPAGLGMRYSNPLEMDFSIAPGFRIYEAPDQYHEDLNLLYPGGASMQWFAVANRRSGLYLS